jgi:hypothetical protein
VAIKILEFTLYEKGSRRKIEIGCILKDKVGCDIYK